MNKLLLFITLLSSTLFGSAGVEWDSEEGIRRLQTSSAKENYWKLLRFYESQIRTSYCSVASSVIALNALSIEAPESKFLGKYRLFTQEEFFSEKISRVIDRKDVEERGMSLEELQRVLQTFPLRATHYPANAYTQEEMRTSLVSALQNPKQSVLVLYQRRVLGQVGGGHWSPLAAYDEESDSFLVMDVARFKYPPIWMDATTLFSAMQTTNVNGESRGFLILDRS